MPVWFLAIIPLAVVFLWLFFRVTQSHKRQQSTLSSEYFKGLNYHQGLIARPSLPERYRSKILLELGYDYLGAGWFDRAEGLFKEVLIEDARSKEARHNLILIYQQEKDWYKAIDIAEDLYKEEPGVIGPMIAHYYCELADMAKTKGDVAQLENNAHKAQEDKLYDYLVGLQQRHANLFQKAAMAYLSERIRQQPSLEGVLKLITYKAQEIEGDEVFKDLLTAITLLQKDVVEYRCQKCGFSTNTHYWLCPSCNHWGTVKPGIVHLGHGVIDKSETG